MLISYLEAILKMLTMTRQKKNLDLKRRKKNKHMDLGSCLANKNIKNSSVVKHSIRLVDNTNHLKVLNISIIMMVDGLMTMNTNKKNLDKKLKIDRSKNHSDKVMMKSINEVMMTVVILKMKY